MEKSNIELVDSRDDKSLVVLQRSDGWYSGYEKSEGVITQVFDTNVLLLFDSIKDYIDKGYSLICVDASKEAKLMDGRTALESFFLK